MKKKILSLTILLFILLSSFPLSVFAADNITATPTPSVVFINGEEVSFDSYNIDGNNYFKLRDLAYALNGTANQFSVGWDEEKNSIYLTRGDEYEANGSEMQSKGVGKKSAVPTTSQIYMDGEKLDLTAYNISGNNYFKLRDLGKALDFKVSWDAKNNAIIINTDKGYYPEADEFDSSVLNSSADEENNIIVTGVAMVFSGALEEIKSEDFTDIVLIRNDKNITVKLLYIDYKQTEKSGEMQTYFSFGFDNELKDYGVYKLTGNYIEQSFESAEFEIKEPPKPSKTDFYYTWSDTETPGNSVIINSDTVNIIMRFYGKWNYINPDDFADMVLSKEGKPVENNLKYTGKFNQFEWGSEIVTDFYFQFEKAITVPGVYDFTGKYLDVYFEIVNDIIFENPITDKAANSDDLRSIIGVGGSKNNENQFTDLVEFAFSFVGLQNSFYQADLTDFKVLLDGKEVEFSIENYITRDLYTTLDGIDTVYSLYFSNPLNVPGVYEITGKYMGKSFSSGEIKVVDK